MNTKQSGLIALSKGQIKAASRMLARAFRDDPITAYAFAGDDNLDTRLPYTYEFLLRYYSGYTLAYTTSEHLEGIAIWQRYTRTRMSLWHMITSGALWPAIRTGTKVGKRLQSFDEFVERKHSEMISVPHWYLALLGVDPEFQGRGYASLLLRGMLPRIDQECLPCFLETTKEKNIPIYQHFGFNLIGEYIVPDSDLKIWPMIRKGDTAHGSHFD